MMNTKMTLEMPRNILPPFLQKLRTITETVPADIASWSEDGKSYVVHKPTFENILSQYFKGNLQTFVRQLHFYGFRKLDAQDGKWSFAHKSFRRDYPHLLFEIKRKTRNEPGEGAATQAEVQALRTQVAYLQDVVEELRTQLDCVLNLVDSEEVVSIEEMKSRNKAARVGVKRHRNGVVPPVKDEFHDKCSTIASNSKSDAVSAKETIPIEPLSFEFASSDDAASLGELTSDEWLNIASDDSDATPPTTTTTTTTTMHTATSSNATTTHTHSTSATTTPNHLDTTKPSNPANDTKSPNNDKSAADAQKALPTDKATEMVAEATELDTAAVSKVLSYLRLAAGNMTSSQQAAGAGPAPKRTNSFTSLKVASAQQQQQTAPTNRPATAAAIKDSSNQYAALLPLLLQLHIPQVQRSMIGNYPSLAPSMQA